jgi:hypothetical protein|tara:strand:+ start:6129 stop:6332 length:204 start_codon:yes stop_codon:yes gene_type:complete
MAKNQPAIKKEEAFTLSTCPFAGCRGPAELCINPWGKYVICKGCGASGPESPTSDPDKIPINAWNNR